MPSRSSAQQGFCKHFALSGATKSTGQKCTATSRVIVEESMLGACTEALVERVNAVQVGPGIKQSNYMSPMVFEHLARLSRPDPAGERETGGCLLLLTCGYECMKR